MYDVIIIGKGPAGISASLYTVRANLKTLIIGKTNSALEKAEIIENYYGFSQPISGKYLLEEGEKQALRLGAQIINDEVIAINYKDFFEVSTPNAVFKSKTVLLSTGQTRKSIKIEGLKEFEGRGISYCSTCDGFFYNNLKVGVLGYKDYALHEAHELEMYTKNITIFTNGKELDLSNGNDARLNQYKINKKPIVKISGTEFLEKVHFDDGSTEEIDGIFVAYDSASSTDFAMKLGLITEKNSIVVDKDQKTNLDGVFAAGDCTGGFKQISVAVGEGALAAKGIIEYVRNL